MDLDLLNNSTLAKNTVDNYGVISTGRGDNSNVFGSSAARGSEAGIIFINHAGAQVVGSLSFGGGNDELTFEAGSGSVQSVTGNVNGGGGNNILNLTGSNNDYLSGYVANFQTLNKEGSGTWTITGSLQGFQDVNVNEGVLELLGVNSAFTGNMTINKASGGGAGPNTTATLRASAQTLSPDIENYGSLEIRQTAVTGDGVYTGFIYGTGDVYVTGGGRVELAPTNPSGNTYAGSTSIVDGTLAIGAENAIGDGTGDLYLGGAYDYGSGMDNYQGTLEFTADVTMEGNRLINVAGAGGVIDTGGHNVTITREAANTVIGGTGSLTKSGAGTLTVNRDIENGGDVNVAGGTLILSSQGTLGGAASTGALNVATGAVFITNGAVNAIKEANIAGSMVVNNTTFSTSTLTGGTGDMNVLGGEVALNTSTVTVNGGLAVYNGNADFEGDSEMIVTGLHSMEQKAAYISSGSRVGGYGTLNVSTSTVSTVYNGGTIYTGTQANPFGDFNINGDYEALYSGGQPRVEINSQLGDDSSPTAVLNISGQVLTGQTQVKVNNVGGLGGVTSLGIPIITTGGTNDGDFRLDYDYYTPDGVESVVAGTYLYYLQRGDANGGNLNNWYLVTLLRNGQPVIHPGIPVYETYPQVLAVFNRMPTLQQRVGNRSWDGAGTSKNVRIINGTGAWVRVEGSTGTIEPGKSDTNVKYDLDFWRAQVGFDGPVYRTDDDSALVLGATFSYGHAKAKVRSENGDGKINADGVGLGLTATWYDENGFYLDGQGQVTIIDGDIKSSELVVKDQVSDNSAMAYAVSLETGKVMYLDADWSLTPQAQLVYSVVDFDSFTDPQNVKVKSKSSDSLLGRLGLSADYERSSVNSDGTTDRVKLYGIGNLYYEFLDGSKVDVAGTSFKQRNDRFWGGVGLGGSYDWDDDAYSVYGEVGARTSLENFGDSYDYYGTVGVRFNF